MKRPLIVAAILAVALLLIGGAAYGTRYEYRSQGNRLYRMNRWTGQTCYFRQGGFNGYNNRPPGWACEGRP